MKLRTLRAAVSVAAAAAIVTGLTLASLPATALGATSPAASTTLTARNLPPDGKVLAVPRWRMKRKGLV